MVKSKFPGKPSKFVNRKLVNITNCASAQENESARAAEFICYGLSVFSDTFGPEDDEASPFHGFSPFDIETARHRSKTRLAEVEKQYKNRGVAFLPFDKKMSKTSRILPCISIEQISGVKDITSTVCVKQSDVLKKKCETITKTKSTINKQSSSSNNISNNDHSGFFVKSKVNINSSSIASSSSKCQVVSSEEKPGSSLYTSKRFVLPVRSARSSRVIKPNKRFYNRDGESCSGNSSEASVCDATENVSSKIQLKKPRLVVDLSQDGFAWSRSRDETLPPSDIDSETSSLKSSSLISSSSTSGSSLEPRPAPKKVILRKPRLNVDTPPLPNMTLTKLGTVPGRIVCGVCGVTRFYRFVKQARKFGVYSCESCRKFITKVKRFGKKTTYYCRNENGLCSISSDQRQVVWEKKRKEISKETNARCPACWLKMCIKCYCMPENLAIQLNNLLPKYMRDPKLASNRAKKLPQNKGSVEHLKNNSGEQTKLSTNRNKPEVKLKKRYTVRSGFRKDREVEMEFKRRKRKPLTDKEEGESEAKVTNKRTRRKSRIQRRHVRRKRKRIENAKNEEEEKKEDKVSVEEDAAAEDEENSCAEQVNPEETVVKPSVESVADLKEEHSPSLPTTEPTTKPDDTIVDKGLPDVPTLVRSQRVRKKKVPYETILPIVENEIRQKRKAALNSLANIARFTGRICESSAVENQLIVARNLKKRAAAIARRELIPANVKKKEEDKDRIIKRKRKGRMKGSSPGRAQLCGPRVKHVCRSASLVLGRSVATFSSSPAVKLKPKDVPVVEQEKTPVTTDVASAEQIEPPEPAAPRMESAAGSSCTSARMRQPSEPVGNRDKEESAKTKNAPPKTLARTLQDLGRQNCELLDGVKSQPKDTTISIDFWESYDPEEVCKTGFALIGSDSSFRVPSLCFLCGSAGNDKLIHCACCCEPYHRYCVEGGMKDWTDPCWWRIDWVCPRCTVCMVCAKGNGPQVSCQRCRKSYHTECLPTDRIARLHSSDRPWVCQSCLRCKSCNAASVSMFVGNLPLCNSCFRLRQKGNFCPLCQRCYDDNDFDTKMMECGRCKCWVHAKCEGLSNEKYEVLSFLPESVEFVCRMCCDSPPAPWWLAVEGELKAGYLSVLKSLSKNRKACELLKWSPKKQSCICHGSSRHHNPVRFPELSEKSEIESSDQRILKEANAREQFNTDSLNVTKDESNEECLQKKITQGSNVIEQKPNNCNLVSELNESRCIPVERGVGVGENDLRSKFNVKECCVTLKNCAPAEELQIKLTDTDSQLLSIPYQSLEGKGAQFSPHATSQSDSGIGSTDDELKPSSSADDTELNGSKQCFCFGVDTWTKTCPSLLHIKKKVSSNGYNSLLEFHRDMQQVVKSIEGTELLDFYCQTLQDIFPWFDPKYSQICDRKDSSSRQSTKTDLIEKRGTASNGKTPDYYEDVSVVLNGLLGLSREYYYCGMEFDDTRICVLCKSVGDGRLEDEGRLLYCGQNEWIHANCALWSNEVFEEIDGSLQNVHSAISRSRLIRCAFCGKRGASVGCCYRNCPESYHFPCAKSGRCVFMEDKSIYCNLHQNESDSNPLNRDSDFPVTRPVYIEQERRKKKFVPHHQVRVMVGSLSVENLGEFVPDVSDRELSILPCEFVCTRLYWSSVEPWRIVQYSIRTKILQSSLDYCAENETNFTVDHSLDVKHSVNNHTKAGKSANVESVEVCRVLESILDIICVKEEESCLSDPQNPADLLPPELKDAIFEDLPHDILDGISMQDIFPKMMSYDDVSDVKIEKEYRSDSNSDGDSSVSYRKKVKSDDSDSSLESACKRPLSLKHNKLNRSDKDRFILKTSTAVGNKKPKAIVKPDIKVQQYKRLKTDNDSDNNKNCWKRAKILQVDGTTDYSSESDVGSPSNEMDDVSCTPTLHIRIQDTRDDDKLNIRKVENNLNYRILQVDGTADFSSESESGSPKCEDSENSDVNWLHISQLDGTADCINASESSDEKPVKCARCHRTYRTVVSYERHLSTCSADYILSCSESDSSEEEKVSSPLGESSSAQTNGGISMDNPETIVEPSSDFCQGTEDVVEYVVQTSESSDGIQESTCINSALYHESDSPVVNPDNSTFTFTVHNDCDQTEIELPPDVTVMYTPDTAGNCVFAIASLDNDNSKINLNQSGNNTYYITKSKADLIGSENHIVDGIPNFLINSKNISQTKQGSSYCNILKRKKVPSITATVNQPIMCSTQVQPQQQVIDYQPVVSSSPALILQQMPAQNVIPSYMDAYSHQSAQQNIQYITIDSVEKPQYSVLPGPTFQLQSTPVQTVMPTVLGTIIQPNGVEQLLLNTNPTNTLDVFGQQSSGGLIISSNPPQMYVNMETVVSNTVMSSSQFVSVPGSVPGMLSTYSATTTQVYQAAKPMIDVPQGYIVVNTSPTTMVDNSSNSNTAAAAVMQTQQPAQVHRQNQQHVQHHQQTQHHLHRPRQFEIHPQQPNLPRVGQQQNIHQKQFTMNTQHSDGVRLKEECTVMRQITHENKKVDCIKMVNTTEKTILIEPVIRTNLKHDNRVFDLKKPLVTPVHHLSKMVDNIPVKRPLTLPCLNSVNKQKPPEVRVLPQQKIINKVSAIQQQPTVNKFFKSNNRPIQYDNLKKLPEKEILLFKAMSNNSPPIKIETEKKLLPPKIDLEPIKVDPTEKGSENKVRTYFNAKRKLQTIPHLSAVVCRKKEPIKIQKTMNSIESIRILQPNLKENKMVENGVNKSVAERSVKLKEKKPEINSTEINSIVETTNTIKNETHSIRVDEKPLINGKAKSKSPPKYSAVDVLKKLSYNLLSNKSSSKKSSAPKIIYEINSMDGFSCSSTDLVDAWQKVFDAVQAARASRKLPPLPKNPFISLNSDLKTLGLDNNSLKYVLEQMPGVGKCVKYRPSYHKHKKRFAGRDADGMDRVNSTGCARSEQFTSRNKYDMFSWLASRHRRPPKLLITSDADIVNGNSRRATSLNLPMAMRFRHLRETSKEAVGVFRSDIHGRGLFCLRDIDSGEMVIEYAGEVIRSALTDKRERYYTSKGIGCYMFRIDDNFVVDATMKGNAARFINHSCEPNCYSRVVDILGKKHILIFALRRIPQGEELTYDYKFPLEDDKITCHCLSRKCRKYLN